jgi:hypothetical protein
MRPCNTQPEILGPFLERKNASSALMADEYRRPKGFDSVGLGARDVTGGHRSNSAFPQEALPSFAKIRLTPIPPIPAITAGGR